jgi:hypothetical protein
MLPRSGEVSVPRPPPGPAEELPGPRPLAGPVDVSWSADVSGPSSPIGKAGRPGPRSGAGRAGRRARSGARGPSDAIGRAGAPPEPAGEAPSASGAGELSGLRLLLDQLDAMLRDPTLALALKSFTTKLAAGLSELAAAVAKAARHLPRLRLRLPRRLLLALLAMLLPLVLIGLLSSGGDRAAPGVAQRPAAPAGSATLAGVGMPALALAQRRPKPVRVALVLDRTYDPAALRRELRTLGTWLSEHHALGTRVTVIDAQSARASAPLRAVDLAGARPLRSRPSTTAAIRSALGRPQGRRLLVTLGSAAPPIATASTLSIATRPGASQRAPSRRGRRSRVQIDDRRPNALAASVARAIMSISGQREPR